MLKGADEVGRPTAGVFQKKHRGCDLQPGGAHARRATQADSTIEIPAYMLDRYSGMENSPVSFGRWGRRQQLVTQRICKQLWSYASKTIVMQGMVASQITIKYQICDPSEAPGINTGLLCAQSTPC